MGFCILRGKGRGMYCDGECAGPNLLFSQWMRWMGHVVSFLRLPSWDSLTASFILFSNISSWGYTSSHPAGAFLARRCKLDDILGWKLLYLSIYLYSQPRFVDFAFPSLSRLDSRQVGKGFENRQ